MTATETTDKQPFPYIDIFLDPEWRAKAKMLLELDRIYRRRLIEQVVLLFEDGWASESEAEQLADALATFYYRKRELQHDVAEQTFLSLMRQHLVSDEEYEDWKRVQFGPEGRTPTEDAPAGVWKQWADLHLARRGLLSAEVRRGLKALLLQDEGGDTA